MRKIWNVFKKTMPAILAAVIFVTAVGLILAMPAQAAGPKIEKKIYFRLYKAYPGSAYVSTQEVRDSQSEFLFCGEKTFHKIDCAEMGKPLQGIQSRKQRLCPEIHKVRAV